MRRAAFSRAIGRAGREAERCVLAMTTDGVAGAGAGAGFGSLAVETAATVRGAGVGGADPGAGVSLDTGPVRGAARPSQ